MEQRERPLAESKSKASERIKKGIGENSDSNHNIKQAFVLAKQILDANK
tara:strand:- start:336 stop:482 length:147 start_codon:yes stop_codon:yes gene_type:complete